MSGDGEVEGSAATPPLPTSIWVVAWASLAGQAALLLERGIRLDHGFSLVLSVLLGALLVGYVSAGVVRARTVRLVIAWVVLGLSAFGEAFGLMGVDDPGEAILVVLAVVTSAVALGGLAKFRNTDWYAWQRTKPSAHAGAPIGRLVAIGVLVGALAGIIGPGDDNKIDVHISTAGPRADRCPPEATTGVATCPSP